MTVATSARIHPSASVHPSASIDPSAEIGPEVEIGQGVIVGPGCRIGAGCQLRARCIIERNTTLGAGNTVYSFSVLGGDPQDLKYDPSKPGSLVVGSNNVFREGVTLNRSTKDEPTRIGSNCYFMMQSHVGHDCQVGNHLIMGNASMLAGHVRVGNRVNLSATVMIHQFTILGDLVMFQGGAGAGMHVPPFVMCTGVNSVTGLNIVGLRRDPNISVKDIDEVKQLYRAFYRERGAKPIMDVVRAMREREWGEPGERFLRFVEEAMTQEPPRSRGLCGGVRKVRQVQKG